MLCTLITISRVRLFTVYKVPLTLLRLIHKRCRLTDKFKRRFSTWKTRRKTEQVLLLLLVRCFS